VDELSGDSVANLTPIQVADCGATAGQGFDVITKGKHNDAENSILIVSTLVRLLCCRLAILMLISHRRKHASLLTQHKLRVSKSCCSAVAASQMVVSEELLSSR
jgi:hypothetical protein